MAGRRKDGRRVMTVSKTTAEVLSGDEDLSQWSVEELIRGQRRAKNGKFVGRPPKVVARAMVEELFRRQASASMAKIAGNLPRLVDRLIEIALDPATDPQVAVNAIRLAASYGMGKPPDRVIVDVSSDHEPLWARALREATIVGIVPTVPEPPEAEIVEGGEP